MNNVKRLKRSRLNKTQPKLKSMDLYVQSHQAWRGSVTILEAQSMLANESPFTYVLSKGNDKYHYFLHFVGADHKVHIKNIRIRFINEVPVFRNGGGCFTDEINDLIPSCLKCSKTVCQPKKD